MSFSGLLDGKREFFVKDGQLSNSTGQRNAIVPAKKDNLIVVTSIHLISMLGAATGTNTASVFVHNGSNVERYIIGGATSGLLVGMDFATAASIQPGHPIAKTNDDSHTIGGSATVLSGDTVHVIVTGYYEPIPGRTP